MNTRKAVFYIILIVNLMAIVLYAWLLKPEITTLYHEPEAALPWLRNLVETLYPRFFTEKHRFNLPFFLGKAEQMLVRFVLLSIFFLLVYYRNWLAVRISFFQKSHFKNFWNGEVSKRSILVLQAFLALVWMYESFTWYKSLKLLSRASEFYEAHLLLRWLPFPNENGVSYWFMGLYILMVASFIPRFRVFGWLGAIFVILILQGFLYGFGKIDHTYATWGYVSMLMPFLLFDLEKNKEQMFIPAWSLRLMQVVVACVYLQTGLEKLLIAGFSWFEPQTLQTHLQAHPTSLGLWVAQFDILCIFLSLAAIIFEVGFISILLLPKAKYIFLPMGVLFHTGTFVLMGIGGFPSLWWLVYIVWFLEKKQQSQINLLHL